MDNRNRLLKILSASPSTLARVDAALDGEGRNIGEADVRLITFTDAAKRLKVSRGTVYRLATTGRLEVVPLNGVRRIRLRSLIEFAEGRGASDDSLLDCCDKAKGGAA